MVGAQFIAPFSVFIPPGVRVVPKVLQSIDTLTPGVSPPTGSHEPEVFYLSTAFPAQTRLLNGIESLRPQNGRRIEFRWGAPLRFGIGAAKWQVDRSG